MKAGRASKGVTWVLVVLLCRAVLLAQPTPEKEVLQRVWEYRPELPKALLDSALGNTGDARNLHRCLDKMLTGQPVKVVIMGGSIALRGWNSPDQTYAKQVHRWLELALVPGCIEAARTRASRAAQTQQGADINASEPVAAQPAEGKLIHRGPVFQEALHQSTDPHYLATGHMCDASHIQLVMLAVPAAGPGYAERCVLPKLPSDTDLLVLDWACNDIVKADRMSHPERHALERILRTALSLTPQPAIVMFSAYSWFQAAGTYAGVGKGVGTLAQDKHTVLAEYYGNIQVVSARAALYPLLAATNDTTNRLIYLGRANEAVSDLLHVTTYGHRWYADILINFFRTHLHTLLVNRIAARALGLVPDDTSSNSNSRGDEPQYLPLYDGLSAGAETDEPGSGASASTGGLADKDANRLCWGSGPAVWAEASNGDAQEGGVGQGEGQCVVQGSLGASYTVGYSGSERLKPPYFRGNEADPGGVCAIGPEFQGVVTQSEGWEWRDDGRPGQPKLSYATEQPDKPLVIDLGSLAAPSPSARHTGSHQHIKSARGGGGVSGGGGGGSADARERSREPRAWLVYLTSWRGMGKGQVTCHGGCSCVNATLDAFNNDIVYKTTVPALHGLTLALHAPPENCYIQVTLLPEPAGGLFSDTLPARFKVMGVTTSHAPVWHLSEVMKKGLNEVTQQADIGHTRDSTEQTQDNK